MCFSGKKFKNLSRKVFNMCCRIHQYIFAAINQSLKYFSLAYKRLWNFIGFQAKFHHLMGLVEPRASLPVFWPKIIHDYKQHPILGRSMYFSLYCVSFCDAIQIF